MIRGTTPTLEFIFPFDTSLIAEMYITITQNGVTMLEKTLSDCKCSGTFYLTESVEEYKFMNNATYNWIAIGS